MDNFIGLREKISKLFSSSRGSEVFNNAEKLVSEYHMLDKIEGGVCVGFSGGADSVMLVSFLYEMRSRLSSDFKISAIHINHCIRGDEADRDEEFCRLFCGSLDVDFTSVRINVPELAAINKKGIEEAARDARYAEFNKLILGRNDIACIAVAHNSTDNLETVLFNMMRGTGISGMCGINPVRDNIIRPLLSISKNDIVEALSDAAVPYVTDSTNLSVDYTRNYIRHKIIPLMTKLSDSPEEACFRMTSNLLTDKSFIDSVCEDFLLDHKERDIHRRELIDLHSAVSVRVIMSMAKEQGSVVESVHLKKILLLLAESSDFSYSLPGSKRFVCEDDICFISDDKVDDSKTEYCYPLHIGENIIDEIGARIVLSYEPIPKIYSNVYNFSIHAYTSSAIIDDGLCVRSRKDGDAYRFGKVTRKLKKLFIDRKIPNKVKEVIPIVCDSLGIVWVPGFKVRDTVDKEECRELYITLELKESDSLLYEFFKYFKYN